MPVPPMLRRRLLALLVTGALGSGLAGTAVAAGPAVAAATASAPAPAPVLLSSSGARLPRGVVLRRTGPAPTPRAALRTSPAPAALTAAPVSRFTIDFVDGSRRWSEQAKAAFRAATDTWSRSIESPVPITVTATATNFSDPAVLGGAGPTDFVRNTEGTSDPRDDVYEPIALANARAGRDLSPSSADIDAEFNPTQPDLYLGTDGRPGPNQLDFRTVVLHELGHGLGLVGSESLVGTRADIGITDQRTGVRNGLAYDQFTYATSRSQAGTGGARTLSLPDGSAALRAALTGDQLYWAGQQALSSTPGRPVRLYAPVRYEEGSTYGHVDERSYPRDDSNGLMTPVLADGESFASPGALTLGMLADLGYAVPALTGSRYTALNPVRLLDTRSGTGAPRGRVGPGGSVDLKVTGVAGVPLDAVAVVVNVTAVAPSVDTDVRVYPTPTVLSPVPNVSNLNLAGGATRANLVTVPVGSRGQVRLRNAAGSVSLLADLAGFYAPGAASSFAPLDPRRVLDTRRAVGTPTTTRVPAGGVVDLALAATSGVPADATAVALTVTAVDASATTDVRAYPTPAVDATPPPTVSNVNLRPGGAVPNVVVVRLGRDGKVRLRNSSGQVHLLADLAGYYSSATAGSLFRPATPARILDTRSRALASGAPTRVGPGGSVDLRVGGVARVPRSASAAVLNVTGVGASASTDVRVFPGGAAMPEVSNLNLVHGQTAAGLAMVRLSGGRLVLRNSSGSLGLVADVSGWFGPAS